MVSPKKLSQPWLTRWRHKLLWHCCWCSALFPYMFIICSDYVHQTTINLMRQNGFTLKKSKKLLTSTSTQAESQLHRLEPAAGVIGFHLNADKTKYLCFNKKSDISILNDNSWKFVEKFRYLGSCISSTESNINMRLAKAWTAIDRLFIIWMSNLSDKMKCDFF